MDFEKTVPSWSAAGTEPPDSLKESGFQAGYKPPADYFNWFWHGTSEALKELQTETPKQIAAVANERQITTYTALAQIGLSGAVTMEQVCTAMPDGSMFLLGNTVADASGNYISDVPADYGTVEIARYNASRIFALFTKASDEAVKIYAGKYHTTNGWSGWLDLTAPSLETLGAQAQHYFYEPTDIGCTVASTPTEIWNAMPDHSVFIYTSTSLTSEEWNFPTDLGVVRIEKYAVHRGFIEYFSKVETTKDYRMYLDNTTGNPSGVWYAYYTTANKPTLDDVGALAKKPGFIELTPETSADNGGYIDFHYAGSTDDYTSRIIEGGEGRLTAEAPDGFVVSHNLRVNGELKMPDVADSAKGTRIYTSDGLGLAYLTDALDTNSARTGIKINVPSEALETLVRAFIATEAGDAKWYNLYGEHNVDSLRGKLYTLSATDVTAGSASSDPEGSLRFIYETT